MDRRGPTFHDLWTLAIVAVTLAGGVLLVVGPPTVDVGARRISANLTEMACSAIGGFGCARVMR